MSVCVPGRDLRQTPDSAVAGGQVGGAEAGDEQADGARMDRHAATRRLHQLAGTAGIRVARGHPHMLRHNFRDDQFDAGAGLRDVQIAARYAGPRTTMR